MLTPVIILNSSPATWATDPLPAEAKLTLPGLARSKFKFFRADYVC
jgi:hypothetical protein